MKFRFEIQECQTIIVEADTAEEARMKIINCEVETIMNNSCRDLSLAPYVSDGVKVID